MPNCNGFIILDLVNKKTVLVESKSGNLSFPKGKIEKSDKSDLDCAYRELEEETGITPDLIVKDDNITFSEFKKDNIRTIKYYIGYLKENFNDFKYDHKELKSVRWYDYETLDSLENLKLSRKEIFRQVKNIKID